MCVCARTHACSPRSSSPLFINKHIIFSLTFPSISAPLVYTQMTPSVQSFHSPHLLFHQLKYGEGAGRTHISEPPQSVQPRAAAGSCTVKPSPTAKLPCWMNRCCCSLHASRGLSRARAMEARSSPSPCTCPTSPPSWTMTVTSPSPICRKCAFSLNARKTSCQLSPHHSSLASSSSSSFCCPPPFPSPTPSPSPFPWRCASATWSPRQPP